MLRIARKLDQLVAQTESLAKISHLASGLKNEDLTKLLANTSDSRLQKKSKLIGKRANIEYFIALVTAASQELKHIADLTDPTVSTPEEEPAVSGEHLTTPEAPAAPAVPTSPEETSVDISLSDNIEVMYDENKDLFLKMPDSSVLKITEASAKECRDLKYKMFQASAPAQGKGIEVEVQITDGKILYQTEQEMYIAHSDKKSVLKLVEVSPRELAKLKLTKKADGWKPSMSSSDLALVQKAVETKNYGLLVGLAESLLTNGDLFALNEALESCGLTSAKAEQIVQDVAPMSGGGGG